MLERPAPSRYDFSFGQNGSPFPLTFGPAVSAEILVGALPPTDCCDYLVSKYFIHLAPLFPIIHGPTFQRQYSDFLRAPTKASLSWLALLFVVCSLALNTTEPDDSALAALRSNQEDCRALDMVGMSRELRGFALTCLSQDQFLVHHDLNTLEALLVLIYAICHNEGVERGWTLLGMALNIGIAMRCNADSKSLGSIETERRRRCWAGILMLHTYQGIVFRDIDMSFLLNIKATMPTEADDLDTRGDIILPASSQSSEMSLMKFKIRLFQLTIRICSKLSETKQLDESTLGQFDGAIAGEQQEWDKVYLVDGAPSVLDTASYAHWCILQTYAYQLFLLIHRPFYRSRSPHFRPTSRDIYLKSSSGLLDIHRQFCQLPRLRSYRWLVHGMTSFNALQGAVALASCLFDLPDGLDATAYRQSLEAAVSRMETLQNCSPVCTRAYPILRHLHTYLTEHFEKRSLGDSIDALTDDWPDMDWLNPESENWTLWEGILDSTAGQAPT
ncbi:hypothetical protein TGAMA5MH_06602 [Trichoderma gamsii]|uniref:Xylanolytic transcriptional activator regulatory domain-containing protein n=1 Tax=Trichoderma gamsii TaxID=398673 RepID=A0A2K0T7L8_9HYPO|nr:hypothetical protein TGAMA5MH_06602 [Trichoderma gamsii]